MAKRIDQISPKTGIIQRQGGTGRREEQVR